MRYTVNESYRMLRGVIMACMAREMVGIRLNPELKALVQALADDEERTFSWMAERLLAEALKARGRTPADETPQRSSSDLPPKPKRG